VPTTSLPRIHRSSCRSRFSRVPMAMQYRRPKHSLGHMFRDYYHRLLVLSRENDQEDGLLQAREIVGLDLNADLVTLSACDAGAGRIEGVVGMNSLVQAFLMAGPEA
ncbi:MAG TPA: CHAT domain-containing protein, partial [Nitrospira sp.]|nr:CHAT domain-containing protein [Nitrospira sp.]